MMDARDEVVHELALRQHGLVNYRQALDAGLSRSALRHRIASGAWVPVRHHVYRVGAAPDTWHQQLMVLCLAAYAVASHRAAAFLWGLQVPQGVPEVSVSRQSRFRPDGAITHTTTQRHLVQTTLRDGIPCTGIARTLLDVAAVVPQFEAERLMDEARRKRLLDWPDLYQTLVNHSIQGRNGCGPLRAILDVRLGEAAIPDSRFNRMVQSLLVSAGLPTPVLEHVNLDDAGRFLSRVDLAYPEIRLAIELDSRAFHTDERVFEHDRSQRNTLALHGWLVLAFTWRMYRDKPMFLVNQIRRAIASRSPGLASGGNSGRSGSHPGHENGL